MVLVHAILAQSCVLQAWSTDGLTEATQLESVPIPCVTSPMGVPDSQGRRTFNDFQPKEVWWGKVLQI